MDAIFGIWHQNGVTVDRAALERMGASVKHVPTKSTELSLRCEGPIGAGRLTIRHNAEYQPLTQVGHLLCVADARLYRAPDIAVPLDLSTPEKEHLVCRLHSSFGDEAPNQLDGDFAYAVWDGAKNRLSLVRDHVGVRPMFYYHSPGKMFAWASHPDILVHSGIVPAHFDVDAAIRSYAYDTSNTQETLVRGLKRLPPAHILRVSSNGSEKIRRYWKLKCVDPITDEARFEECASNLNMLLQNAVRRRLPKSETIGAHLSGGLDSTSISIIAARALNGEKRPLHTYSFVSETRPGVQFLDERPYVDATVQSEPNIYNTKITPSERDESCIDIWADRMANFTGAEEKLIEAAERDDVDIILSGWGGDEVVTFNGRGAYAEHFVRGRWRLLWKEIGARSQRIGASKKSIFANEVLAYLLPQSVQDIARRIAGKDASTMLDQKLEAVVKPPFRNRINGGVDLGFSARRNRQNLFESGYTAFRLETWALQGAHHGMQYAFPLLDKELLEFSIRLPARFFVRGGLRRAIFREAMRDVLPESVRSRRQKLVPFPCSLLRLSEHKAEYLENLAKLREDPQLASILDFDAIEEAIETIADPERVKEAFNAAASGGPSPSLSPTFIREIMHFTHFLKNRLNSRSLDE